MLTIKPIGRRLLVKPVEIPAVYERDGIKLHLPENLVNKPLEADVISLGGGHATVLSKKGHKFKRMPDSMERYPLPNRFGKHYSEEDFSVRPGQRVLLDKEAIRQNQRALAVNKKGEPELWIIDESWCLAIIDSPNSPSSQPAP